MMVHGMVRRRAMDDGDAVNALRIQLLLTLVVVGGVMLLLLLTMMMMMMIMMIMMLLLLRLLMMMGRTAVPRQRDGRYPIMVRAVNNHRSVLPMMLMMSLIMTVTNIARGRGRRRSRHGRSRRHCGHSKGQRRLRGRHHGPPVHVRECAPAA